MNVSISWNEDGYDASVQETEGDLWKEVSKNLPNIPIPNTLNVSTPYGDASLSIRQRGTYVKDGVKMPSMYVTVINNRIYGLKPSTYQDAYLTCVNAESNNYKFYHLKPRPNGIGATYGRIGSSRGEAFGEKDLQKPYEPHLYWVRYYEKLSKGYVDQSDVYLAPNAAPAKPAAKMDSKRTDNPVSAELYQKLKAYARHVVQTNLESSDVTQAQVDKSKDYLNQMGQQQTVQGFNDQLMKLLMVCPRKARYVHTLLATNESDFPDIMAREENLTAAMEALVNDDGIPTADQVENFDSLGIEVYAATDEQKKQVLSHLSDNLKPKIKNVYRVINQKHQKRFNDYLKQNHIKKVKQLWHGSGNENWFSILVNGLQLNPNARITGKMFGHGIYFAPSSMKSWNYTSYHGTIWARGTSDTGFMGLYATAYGKPLDVSASGDFTQSGLKTAGYDCVHAHAGSALLNDEIIYYNEAAIICNYIAEFK